MHDGVLSTCDMSEPHYHLAVSELEIYPGDKMVIRGCAFMKESCRFSIGLILSFLLMMKNSILRCRKLATTAAMDIISRTATITISVKTPAVPCFMITTPARLGFRC